MNRPETKKSFNKDKLCSGIAMAMLVVSGDVLAETVLEEVVVTATRRAQSTLEVPYNITAVSGQTISDSGLSDLNDIAAVVPGLVTADLGADSGVNNSLIMRGLNANNPGATNILPNVVEPSVSTYLNNTPVYLNLKLADLNRVEVLRGPQGTLYGSGSVGGTVRFIFNEPDPTGSSAKISVGTSTSSHSGESNYDFDFVGNLALSDTAAIRVAAGVEHLGGVTDATNLSQIDGSGNVVPEGGDAIGGGIATYTQKDTDDRDVTYLRAAAAFSLSSDTDVLLSVMRQESDADSDTYRRITDGVENGADWENGRRFLTPTEFEAQIVSLEVESELGFATFSSSTSTTNTEVMARNDISSLYESIDEATGGIAYFGSPRLAFMTEADAESEGFTQEFRLVSAGDSSVEWVLGAYYSDTESDLEVHDVDYSYEAWLASVPDVYYGLGTFLDVLNTFSDRTPPYTGAYYQDRSIDFTDKAVFGELTYRLSDDMQVTVGLRKFWQEFDASQTVALPYCGFYCAPDGNLNGATSEANSADFDDQLLKINFSYDIDDNTMVYATWSEGFRHGGANSFPTSGFAGVDTSFLVFQPDEATNIEFGVKGSIGDTTRYSFAAYRIDWENAQLDVYAGALGIPGVVNGDEARSQGLELEVNTIMGENLTVDLGLGYTDAEVTTDAGLLNFTDFVTARKGDPLPGVPDVQASLALNYLQPLSSGDLRYNLTASYRSSAETNFNEDFGNYANLDAFTKINASVTWQKDAVAVTGYVKNLTDEAGLTGVQNGRAAYSHIGFVGRPRTVGIRVSYDF